METNKRKAIDRKLGILKSVLLSMPANEMKPIVKELIEIVQDINGRAGG